MSESGSQVIGRWFWLIAFCGFLGAAAGYLVIPAGLPAAASFDSSTSLGVSRFVSVAGGVSNSDLSLENSPLARYTTTIGPTAQSPQFLSQLQATLADKGLPLLEAEILDKVKVTPDPGVYRVTIHATGATFDEATLLAQTTSDLLIQETAVEEWRIRDSISRANAARATELLADLNEVYEARLARVRLLDPAVIGVSPSALVQEGNRAFTDIMRNLARLTGDPELALLNSQAEALEAQLLSLASTQETFSAEVLESGQPLFVVSAVETVARTPQSRLDKPELVLMGGFGGLVMGWIGANGAENLRRKRQRLGRGEATALAEHQSPSARPSAASVAAGQRERLRTIAERNGRNGGDRPELAEAYRPPIIQRALIVHPIKSFNDVYQLHDRLTGLPGVRRMKVVRLSGGVLELSVDCFEDPPLSQTLAMLDRFPHRIVAENTERLEISLSPA
jgi:hypothetical protein